MSEIINTLLRASAHRFIGRLGRDPEVRFFENGNCVANASIGVNRPGAKKDDGTPPDWIKVELWGEKAQAFADACRKGQLIDVTGRVKTDRWTDRTTGEEKVQLCVTGELWSIVATPGRQAPAAAAPAAPPAHHPAYAAAGHQPAAARPLAPPDNDGIPF